ncbi:MAG TPA: NAD(P)/FAD-dependent oxidoreductase [Terriglobales bacterium]
MEVTQYDLVVAGGGPAGAAAAITAARAGFRVLLLDRGRFPRHKVCGEFVSAESIALLCDLLGSGQSSLLAPGPRTVETRVFVDGVVTRLPIAPAASISRYELDAALWQAAKGAGAECHQEIAVRGIARRNGGFAITSLNSSWNARAVIDATGRWSNLRPAPKSPNGPLWLGLKAHYISLESDDSTTDLYFFDGGYCGVQPFGNRTLNVCAMIRSDAATELPDVFPLHPALQARSQNWTQITDAIATAPLMFQTPTPVAEGILRAGDSGAFIDPFVGDGISIALRSGVLAAESLAPFFSRQSTFDQAVRAYESEYHRRFAGPLRTARRLRSLLDAPVTLRRLAVQAMQIPAVAEYVVSHTR